MKKANKKKTRRKPLAPKKSGEIAVSYAALSETEQSLKHEITSVKVELRSAEKKLSAKIDAVEAKLSSRIDAVEAKLSSRIDAVEAKLSSRIDAVEAKLSGRIDSVDSKLEQVLAAVHRVAALVEEQNSRNRFVLDGYTSLHDSQDEIKARLEKLEKDRL